MWLIVFSEKILNQVLHGAYCNGSAFRNVNRTVTAVQPSGHAAVSKNQPLLQNIKQNTFSKPYHTNKKYSEANLPELELANRPRQTRKTEINDERLISSWSCAAIMANVPSKIF
ncbi:hypothetical protein BaRGS_00019891 [Batillaria attramentaria]|uniref:Uncharacterized protein n=1 Tax=Batillaria attramentaria TaxID=370345 RepID=A0ABD0KPH1_9CAEN